MDAVIERKAKQQRAVAQFHLDQQLDWLRLRVGLVEVVPRQEDVIQRRLRRSGWPQTEPDRRGNPRPLFDFNGGCLIVRDTERIQP